VFLNLYFFQDAMKKSGNGSSPIFLRRVPAGSAPGSGTQLIPLTSLPNTATKFLRPTMTGNGASQPQMSIRAIPANTIKLENPNTPLPITLSLPRVPVAPAMTTSPRCLVLPNQPVPQREVFQRPLPPSNMRPQMVRAFLIPRPGLNTGQQHQQQTTVIISPSQQQQHQQQQQHLISHQRLQSVNTGTPLPNIQLPSEPLPITAQEMQQHLSTFSSPSTSPSPASESGNFLQTLDLHNTINNAGSQNGFSGNGNIQSGQDLQDGSYTVRQQQNPQKIFIQVIFLSYLQILFIRDM
jgi:hypothetical protein